jgi:hypothetical protein
MGRRLERLIQWDVTSDSDRTGGPRRRASPMTWHAQLMGLGVLLFIHGEWSPCRIVNKCTDNT